MGTAIATRTELLARFDVHGVLPLLRARHHGTASAAACALLVPVGSLDEETAREAVGEPDLPAAARLLGARRLPDPDSAAALLKAQRRYEIDIDLARVEEIVARSARAHQLKVLIAAGSEAEPAVEALRREADDLNLLLALRLREQANGRTGAAASAAADSAQTYLRDGTLPLPLFAAIRRAPTRAEVPCAAASAPPPLADSPCAPAGRGDIVPPPSQPWN